MTAAVWQENVIPGKTQIKNWTNHILELRRAVDQIIQTINQFDSVTAVEWLPIEPGRPKAEAMTQLHSIVLAL